MTGNSPSTTTYDPEIVDNSPDFDAIFEAKFDCDASPLHAWTQYFDTDNPSGYGDFETLTTITRAYGDHPCSVSASTSSSGINHIDDVDCRDISTNVDYDNYSFDTNVELHLCEKDTGFVCRNGVGSCPDFKVRFCCYLTTAAPTTGMFPFFHLFFLFFLFFGSSIFIPLKIF